MLFTMILVFVFLYRLPFFVSLSPSPSRSLFPIYIGLYRETSFSLPLSLLNAKIYKFSAQTFVDEWNWVNEIEKKIVFCQNQKSKFNWQLSLYYECVYIYIYKFSLRNSKQVEWNVEYVCVLVFFRIIIIITFDFSRLGCVKILVNEHWI